MIPPRPGTIQIYPFGRWSQLAPASGKMFSRRDQSRSYYKSAALKRRTVAKKKALAVSRREMTGPNVRLMETAATDTVAYAESRTDCRGGQSPG